MTISVSNLGPMLTFDLNLLGIEVSVLVAVSAEEIAIVKLLGILTLRVRRLTGHYSRCC